MPTTGLTEPPFRMTFALGVKLIEKSERGTGVISRKKVSERVMLPAVAEIAIGYEPCVTEETVNVMTALQGGLQEAVENLDATPLGAPETLKETFSLVPESWSRFAVTFTDSPVETNSTSDKRESE